MAEVEYSGTALYTGGERLLVAAAAAFVILNSSICKNNLKELRLLTILEGEFTDLFDNPTPYRFRTQQYTRDEGGSLYIS